MSAPAAVPSSDVLHISTKFDESVHEYQFARSHPQLFAQLQQLTAAKYPLTPLYIHYTDEDGDMVRVTNEAELREAVRVCGSRLKLVLSSGLPSSASSAPSTPQQQSMASPTVLLNTPSPSPSLASPSPAPLSSLIAGSRRDSVDNLLDDIDDYPSSDEEELFEQARSQARGSQLSQHSIPDIEVHAEAEPQAEAESPRFGVVALDSDEEEDDVKQPGAAHTPVAVTPVAAEQHAAHSAVQAASEATAASSAVASDNSEKLKEDEDKASAVQAVQPPSPRPQGDSLSQPAPASERRPEEKGDTEDCVEADKADNEDGVEAINARLRSFYQLDEQLRAVVSSATTASTAAPVQSPSAVPIASLFSSFFSEPAVIATIRDNAALLTPLMASSFPVFLHQLCLLNPILSSHPLTRYTFSLSSLHPFTVCVHCSASPVIGRLLYCRSCEGTLCGSCQSQHPADHELTELAVREFRRGNSFAATAFANLPANAHAPLNANSSASSIRVDDGGRVLEERKASDFAELSDRMRASGQKVLKQGAVSLRKVDEMLSQFAADIKHMIESMLDGVFSDAPKPPQQPQPQAQPQQYPAEEQKQQQPLVSPRWRQPAGGCNFRRQCIGASIGSSRFTTAPPLADAREAGIALAQPVRQSMPPEQPRPQQQPQPQPQQQQQASSGFAYRAQLDLMNDMGLIKSMADEETCKELLTASKGNVDQAVQWLMDKINV